MDNRSRLGAHQQRNAALLQTFRERSVSLSAARSVELHFWTHGHSRAVERRSRDNHERDKSKKTRASEQDARRQAGGRPFAALASRAFVQARRHFAGRPGGCPRLYRIRKLPPQNSPLPTNHPAGCPMVHGFRTVGLRCDLSSAPLTPLFPRAAGVANSFLLTSVYRCANIARFYLGHNA